MAERCKDFCNSSSADSCEDFESTSGSSSSEDSADDDEPEMNTASVRQVLSWWCKLASVNTS